jgi:ligand-binding sensor domain-containing protein
MVTRVCLLAFLCAVSVFAAGKAKQPSETRVDSMVYDQPTEWRIFNTGGLVTAFAIQGDLLWYATEAGVTSLGIKKGNATKYPNLGGIPSTDVTCMVVDNSGKIWIGGKNGVACKGERDKDFTSFTKDKGLPDDAVNAIASTEGAVWVGTDAGAACWQGGEWKVFTSSSGLASNKVQCLTSGDNGEIWCGTSKGISMYSLGKWTTWDMKKGLSWNDTKAIAYDPRKNAIWAAVGEKDINSYDGKSWTQYGDIQAGVTSIMIDTQGRVWIGSLTGIQKFNGDEWINDPKQLGIPAAQVTKMFKDGGGNLWFGMESGVLRFNNPYPF